MVTGSITFNGLTDDDIIALLELKKQHPEMVFNPAALNAGNVGGAQGSSQPPQLVYNNAPFQWHDALSLALVKEILRVLTERRP